MGVQPFALRRWLAALLLLSLTLSGCAPASQGEETGAGNAPALTHQEEEPDAPQPAGEALPFTLGYYQDLGLNPYTCNNTTNQSLSRLLYEPLFQQSPAFQTEACLARSCTPQGDGTWELTLEPGITFWNGETLDAGDVVASLQAAAREDSLYAQRLEPLEDLRQTGANTLTFTWSESRGDLAVLLEIPIVQAGTQGDAVPMGTGPYQPQRDEGGVLQSLTAYGGWWQGEQLPTETVALYPVEDSEMLIYGFESGEISLVSTDLTGTNRLEYSGSFEVWDYPTTYLLYLGCNTSTGPGRERDFRLALQSALDRETIVERLLSGHADPSPLTFHPDSPYYDGELAEQLQHLDLQPLRAYGGERVTILVNGESSFRREIGAFLEETLESAGLEAEVNALAWEDYQEALEAGEYDLYLGLVRLEPDFNLHAFFDLDGSLQFSAFAADEITAALEDYDASNAGQRVDRAKALSLAISEQAPILPLCFLRHSILSHWGSLGSSAATQTNLFYHIQDWTLDARETEGRSAP